MSEYRLGVIGVFINELKEVLVCERSDITGVWQLPQGGLERGESPQEAFQREMQEELGTSRFRILRQADLQTRYNFPDKRSGPIQKKYRGQQHHWFLAMFNQGELPDLSCADGEFSAWKWCKPNELLEVTIDWKLAAYQKGLNQFDLVS